VSKVGFQGCGISLGRLTLSSEIARVKNALRI
jgi:hypothetical protein